MRVQLSEKSKAKFIELITKDSITCWFEGDEFVMPSGQGKTAKGIVLGKLLVWQHRQTEVNELTLQVAEMKSRLNDAYTDGQSAMYTARQSKVDELTQQKSLQELEINQIAHANQQWQLKCGELQEKLDASEKTRSTLYEENVDLRAKNDELQKRVDAVKALIEEYRDPPTEDKTFQHALSIVAYELEQALKCGFDE